MTTQPRHLKKKRNIILLLAIIVTIIGVLLFISIQSRNDSIKGINIEDIVSEQNEDFPSYFIVLTPDKMANMMIDMDVVGFTNESGYVVGINQENPHTTKVNDTITYKRKPPNLVYLQYGSKKVAYSGNPHYYDAPGSFSLDFDLNTGQVDNARIPNQIFRLKYVPKNITDFKLLIYATDEYAESHLYLYPFDSINSSMMFEFPNKTNINFIIKIPDELKDYSVTPMVKSVNKTNGKSEESVNLKSIYDKVYRISTTKEINLQDNYILVTITMKRPFISIEVISFILLLIISVVFLFGMLRATTINWEHVSLYIAVSSILISNLISKQPTTDSTIYSTWISVCLFIGIPVVAFIRHEILKRRAFDPPL